MVTFSGVRSGTLEATRLAMAATWLSLSSLPVFSVRNTEAVVLRLLRTNTERSGVARCTRADCTLRKPMMVRCSSPSWLRR